jgi:hypothetical protein
MRKNNGARRPEKPARGWQRPWLVDDDLKSDEAIELGCPDVKTGLRVSVKFPVQQVREFMSGANKIGQRGNLVINRGLIRKLTRVFAHYGVQHGKDPDAITLPDYPFLWFVPFKVKTFRKMSEGVPTDDDVKIPSSVTILIFLAVHRRL